MIEEEFLQLFNQNNLEIQSTNSSSTQINQEAIKAQTLAKIRLKEQTMLMKDMSWDDRYEWLMYQKNKGNKCYYQQQFDQAIQIYQQIATAMDLNNTPERNEIMKSEIQNSIMYNLALCYKKKKDYDRASQFFDLLIKLHPQPQSILRRASFHLDIQEYEKVQEDLNLINNTNNLNGELKEDYQNIKKQLIQQWRQSKQQCERMIRRDRTSDEAILSKSDEEIEIPSSRLDSLYDKAKSLFIRIFGCGRLFEDDDSESDDESDPKKFLESK